MTDLKGLPYGVRCVTSHKIVTHKTFLKWLFFSNLMFVPNWFRGKVFQVFSVSCAIYKVFFL